MAARGEVKFVNVRILALLAINLKVRVEIAVHRGDGGDVKVVCILN